MGYVAERYLGVSTSNSGLGQQAPRHTVGPVPCRKMQRSASVPAIGLQSTGARLMGASHSSSSLRLSRAQDNISKPPLQMDAVRRACAPCGTLLTWMQQLFFEFHECKKLRAELTSKEGELSSAVKRKKAFEEEASTLERESGVLRKKLQKKVQPSLSPDANRSIPSVAPLDSVEERQGQVAIRPHSAKAKALSTCTSKHLVKSASQPNAFTQPAAAQAKVKVELDVTGLLIHDSEKLAKLQLRFAKGTASLEDNEKV